METKIDACNTGQKLAYRSMVIRYWLENHPTQRGRWRCQLVNPQTGQQMGFQSFSALSAYLMTEFEGEEMER